MPRILIIEDEPKVAQSLQLGLREVGFEVEWAVTGEEGLTCMLENQPDCVFYQEPLEGIPIWDTVAHYLRDKKVISISNLNEPKIIS